MRKTIQVLSVLMCLVLFSACEKEYVKYEPLPSNVSFQSDIVPIFSGCACHLTGSLKPVLTPSEAYNSLWDEDLIDTVQPDASGLYTKMQSGHGGSTGNQQDLVLKWIEQGAQDN